MPRWLGLGLSELANANKEEKSARRRTPSKEELKAAKKAARWHTKQSREAWEAEQAILAELDRQHEEQAKNKK